MVDLAMMWSRGGIEDNKLSLEKLAEAGVVYFTRKYGYPPTKIEYCAADGKLEIQDILCVPLTKDIYPGILKFYPAVDRKGKVS